MRTYLSAIGTISLIFAVVLAFYRLEIGSLSVAIVSGAAFVASTLVKERKAIERHESALIFELAKLGKDEISVSELNQRMRRHATEWDLSSKAMQEVLISVQQAELIEISGGTVKLKR